MALADHLRELRARIMRTAVTVVVAFCVAIFFYDQLLELVTTPYNDAVARLDPGTDPTLVVNGASGGLLLQMKLCGVAALVATAPVWIYQVWAFIAPGLHDRERRWGLMFAAVAGPLFFLGVATGYLVLPTGLKVLIGFVPDQAQSLIEFEGYFSFLSRMLLIFGIAFEIPLFVVMLNIVGAVKGAQLGRVRPWIIIGTFLFAAVATPSTDPFSMIALAIPMTILFLVAEVLARVLDRIRARRQAADPVQATADDQASPL